MFTLTALEILLFEGSKVLPPTQWGAASERVKGSVKDPTNNRILLKLLEKWLAYKLRRFWMLFIIFYFV